LVTDNLSAVNQLIQRALELWEQRDSAQVRKLVRYTMVSITSTIVSFTGLFLIFGVLHLFDEVLSTILANAIATVPSYHLHRRWVWKKWGRSKLTKEILPFWAMAATGIAFSIVGATVARHISIDFQLGHIARTGLVLMANIVSFAIFWVAKLTLYNKIFHVHPIADLDDVDELIELP